ncbi:hypothetical protein K402DRAFT_57042 [Aulographum hederae CBS 113979]|uniref:Uncharacterized protein n=1 Tax=Aulographum hederae CBS 113979 TaxID=1176131 RepID=A0A6G1H243_9PEZI|nr:hypothetical protein K402DRAFT_57042 [Aulographum hederae CBS 113979]
MSTHWALSNPLKLGLRGARRSRCGKRMIDSPERRAQKKIPRATASRRCPRRGVQQRYNGLDEESWRSESRVPLGSPGSRISGAQSGPTEDDRKKHACGSKQDVWRKSLGGEGRREIREDSLKRHISCGMIEMEGFLFEGRNICLAIHAKEKKIPIYIPPLHSLHSRGRLGMKWAGGFLSA